MWFLGLIVGGFIGAIGGGAGAVIGAMAGAGVGWALGQNLKGGGDERLARLETSIRYLQERVAALERAPRAEAQAEIAPVTEEHEPARRRMNDPTKVRRYLAPAGRIAKSALGRIPIIGSWKIRETPADNKAAR